MLQNELLIGPLSQYLYNIYRKFIHPSFHVYFKLFTDVIPRHKTITDRLSLQQRAIKKKFLTQTEDKLLQIILYIPNTVKLK